MSIQLTVRTWAKAQLLATTGLTVYPSPRADIPVEELAAGPALCMFSHHDRPADAAADSSRPHERIYTLAVDQQHVGRQEEDTTEALAILEDGAWTATMFYAEADGRPEDRDLARAFDELQFFSEKFEVLGVYPADPFRNAPPAG